MKASSKPISTERVPRADVYRHRNGCVVLIKYHLIWIPRRRRKVLVGAVADRLEQLLQAKCAELEIMIEHLAIQPDHLHLFIEAPPMLAPSQIAFRLKGYTSQAVAKRVSAVDADAFDVDNELFFFYCRSRIAGSD